MKSKYSMPMLCIGFGVLLMLGVLGFGAYSKTQQGQMIGTYEQTMKDDPKGAESDLERARIYNENMVKLRSGEANSTDMKDPGSYESIFADNNGMIGILTVDKISLRLPIYHGTTEEQLMAGVGHVTSTAFPLDTQGAKSVLTGHNGVPGADMLFTRLDEINLGDTFKVQVGNEIYHYRVRDIKPMLTPEQADAYAQIPNKPTDKQEVTLITCTPYGVNTHRLLVIGEFTFKGKVADEGDQVLPVSFGKETIVIVSLLTVGGASLIFLAIKRHRERTYF